MKAFFVTALVVGMVMVYGSELHATLALDYNGVRALIAHMIASVKS